MVTIMLLVLVKRRQKVSLREERPEEEFLSSLFFDDVELVIVPQSTGHLLIGHIVPVLSKESTHDQGHELLDFTIPPCAPLLLNFFLLMCSFFFLSDETHKSTISPCGFPKDVPIHWDRLP